MRLQTGGRAKYGKTGGELVLRRAVGQQDVEWGSAPSQARRRGSRLRRQPQQSLPAAEVQAASNCDRSSCMPAGSRFAVLAEDESEEETLAEEGACATAEAIAEGTLACLAEHEVACKVKFAEPARRFTEEEAVHKLSELLASWLRKCPEFGGTARQAAGREIEARITWLSAQASLHPCAVWHAAVAREQGVCEEALQHLSWPAALRTP